mmetsp:Transcript_35444/g.43337  ORF Transcript_35444/g.43337 Transcript_35444/m.43337 type:complete len:91 (+) Transcript_35444:1920-2192(+)
MHEPIDLLVQGGDSISLCFNIMVALFQLSLHRFELFLESIRQQPYLLLFIVQFGLTLHLGVHLEGFILPVLSLLIPQLRQLPHRVLQLPL